MLICGSYGAVKYVIHTIMMRLQKKTTNWEPEKHQSLINTELMTGDGLQESQRNWRDKLSRAQNTQIHLAPRSTLSSAVSDK